MHTELPPIVKQAQRLVADIENSVRRFSRYHKYTIGQDLRSQAMTVTRAAFRAWRDQTRQVQRAHELAIAIDELKLSLQLGKDIKAFGSFREFEAVARLASDIGRQCGGWLKRLHSKSQNAGASAPRQRAPILSSQAASQEARP